MRIVHFADLHLDAPFACLPAPASRARRQSLRKTLEAIIELAARERADVITAAGLFLWGVGHDRPRAGWLR